MELKQHRMHSKGFTLIELLVVVLIIGILAAVALPQYQLTIEKSKASAILPLLEALGKAAQQYELATGNWVSSFEELDLKLPDLFQDSNCLTSNSMQCKSNGEWTFAISREYSSSLRGTIYVSRTTGPHKGGGFFYAPHRIYGNVIGQGCLDVHMPNITSGDYCKTVWKMHQRKAGGTSLSFF